MKNTMSFQSPFGWIAISEENGVITHLSIHPDKEPNTETTPLLQEAKRQIEDYLSGNRKTFDLPLAVQGTEFQEKVWDALRHIPYGETRSYKDVAGMIGNPAAFRAVGMANNKNPMLILTPCHRVVGSTGELVGYAAGLNVKEYLLQLEKKHAAC